MATQKFNISLKWNGMRADVFYARDNQPPILLFSIVKKNAQKHDTVANPVRHWFMKQSKLKQCAPLTLEFLIAFRSALYTHICREVKLDPGSNTSFEFSYKTKLVEA